MSFTETKYKDVNIDEALDKIAEAYKENNRIPMLIDKEEMKTEFKAKHDKHYIWRFKEGMAIAMDERNMYIKNSRENYMMKNITSGTLCFRVHVKQLKKGEMFGDIYALDYTKRKKALLEKAVPGSIAVIQNSDGSKKVLTMRQFNPLQFSGKGFTSIKYKAENEKRLSAILVSVHKQEERWPEQELQQLYDDIEDLSLDIYLCYTGAKRRTEKDKIINNVKQQITSGELKELSDQQLYEALGYYMPIKQLSRKGIIESTLYVQRDYDNIVKSGDRLYLSKDWLNVLSYLGDNHNLSAEAEKIRYVIKKTQKAYDNAQDKLTYGGVISKLRMILENCSEIPAGLVQEDKDIYSQDRIELPLNKWEMKLYNTMAKSFDKHKSIR